MIILGYSRLGKDLEVPQGLKLGEKHQNEGCHGGDMVTSTRSEEILIYHTYFSHEKICLFSLKQLSSIQEKN